MNEWKYYLTLNELNDWKWDEWLNGSVKKAKKIQRIIDRILERQEDFEKEK